MFGKFFNLFKSCNDSGSDSDQNCEDLIQMPNGDNIDNNELIKIKDYVYRPDTIDDTNIYDFVSIYVKRKIPQKKLNNTKN